MVSTRGPSAYQPNALPLGQTGSRVQTPGPSGLYTRDRKRFEDPPGQADSKLLKSVLPDRFQASGDMDMDMDMDMAVDTVIQESSGML